MNDDAALIEATLAGDSAAFGLLVQKYQNRLFNTMVHAVGSFEDARDVVQEAFVQAFLKLGSFQRQSGFYTWLYRIAFNVAASQRRRQKPGLSMEQVQHHTGHEPIDEEDSPAQRVEQQERSRQVWQAMATLSDEHRAVLVLREIDGCCYETIAEVLNVPIGTVRSRLHRARLQLREQLKAVLMMD